ncbi:hypothetical protein L6164_029781 [Bauhinia variegata]|uniref:Uncharacterized protein n=1 Tax=Bauhinia variegata TaxID=167791 RepID=A0ACB9LAH1_BAUVA|nr:hypothetical protein L6164_029781 [Bauhinia variegata]
MGGGRKTKTYTLKEKSQPAPSVNFSVTARNLRKSELGGVVFGCKHSTIKECFSNQLFGLPAPHISYVKNIAPGLPLFLFNYSDRKLYGVFEAASEGRLNINPHGWTVDDSECTPFPAQVRIRTRIECKPLLEDQFGPIIADNYYERKLFWFELDREQTYKLISMFSSSPATVKSAFTKSTARQSTLFETAYSSNARPEGGGSERPPLDVNVANKQQPNTEWAEKELKLTGVTPYSGRLYASVVKSDFHPGQVHTGCSSSDTHGLHGEKRSIGNEEAAEHWIEKSNVEHAYFPDRAEMNALPSHLLVGDTRNSHSDVERPQSCCSIVKDPDSSQKKWSGLYENSIPSAGRFEVEEIVTHDLELNLPIADQFNNTLESSCIRSELDAESNSLDGLMNESEQFDEQCECVVQQMEYQCLSVAREDDSCIPQSDLGVGLSIVDARWEARHLETKATEGNTSRSDEYEIENSCLSEVDMLSRVKSSDHKLSVNMILEELNKLKLNQFKEHQKIRSLENELVESRRAINNLKQHLMASEFCSLPELVIKSESWGDASVFIVGGFDGSSFLSTLDCYHPSSDTLDSLCTMTCPRSSTSSVKFNGEVFVIGGVHKNLCVDTVESYNLVRNQWVTHPSLNRKKGNLAGISLNEKIYAIGGGNEIQCFAEVEMFDFDIGRWIPTRSMLEKSFAPAVAEINGMVYVVGGYDGRNYLKSVEGFDPGQYSFSRVESMSTKRGCLSLAVLNEKLYAIGGYNGEQMVSTVEVFDPRMGWWMAGESMNHSRGYSAAVVIGNSVFVIGGYDGKVLDTVEFYKEGIGWQSTTLRAVGKRCSFSAILL